MDDISNRTLALLLVTAIVVSLGVSVVTLQQIGQETPTGYAPQDQGNVTLYVESQVSIILTTDTIDFGAGYVDTELCPTNATLYAGQTYNDTDGVDCWTNNTQSPTSFVIQNDGNRNVTLDVTGPTVNAFFQSLGSAIKDISWRARQNETASCDAGAATFQQTYVSFDGTAQTVCSDFLDDPDTDSLAIDIKVIVPSDLPTGRYENSTIEFSAAAS